jgi:hypothetical protein
MASIFLSSLLSLWLPTTVNAQSSLPRCPKEQNKVFDQCFGTRSYKDGSSYTGEFRKNVISGTGIFTMPDGGKYEGNWRDGELYGQGKYTSPNGSSYVGEWRNGNAGGKGTLKAANGMAYEGEFRNGKPHGSGTSTYPDGGRYSGDFLDGEKSGFGVYIYPDGSRYAGDYKNDLINGKGTFTWSDGRIYSGDHKDGKRNGLGNFTFTDGAEYVGEFRNDLPDGIGTLKDASGGKYVGEFRVGKRHGKGTYFGRDGSVLSAGIWDNGNFIRSATVDTNIGVKLIKEGGTYKVPVRINGILELHFTVDSGAADVTIPADVVLTLMRTGTITEADFVGEQTYVLADGSKTKSKTFRIRNLSVGDQIVNNVIGSIADINGGLLLGQTFLSRFKRVSFDYGKEILILE